MVSRPEFPLASQPLQGPLLAAVSRSFYLSLRFLPPPVRAALSVSYLLARAADTIADVEAAPAPERLKLLEEFRGALTQQETEHFLINVSHFASHITHAGEKELLHRLGECFVLFRKLTSTSQEKIVKVMGHILDGMSLDLQRFPGREPLRSLQTDRELDHYTWLVAGAVGEFWTAICAAELPGVFTRETREMTRLGNEFGKGLQLINILRDQASDAAAGRCYLPLESLQQAGLEPPVTWPAVDWKPWHQVRENLIGRARKYLQSGWTYAASQRSIRLRFASLMPLLIGAGTLSKMENLPANGPPAAVKVSRKDVKKMARRALWMSITGKIPSNG